MTVQPHQNSEPLPAPHDDSVPHSDTSVQVEPSTAPPLWLQRMSLFILVMFCVYLGVIVAILPWWKDVWDNNAFFQSHPELWAILRRGQVRGVISGLGLLDIWIGVSEAVHYREYRTPDSQSNLQP